MSNDQNTTPNSSLIPSNPVDRQEIKKAIIECSNSKTRVEAEQEFQKDVRHRINDDYGIPPRMMTRLVNAYHKQNKDDEEKDFQEFEALYDALLDTNNSQGSTDGT